MLTERERAGAAVCVDAQCLPSKRSRLGHAVQRTFPRCALSPCHSSISWCLRRPPLRSAFVVPVATHPISVPRESAGMRHTQNTGPRMSGARR